MIYEGPVATVILCLGQDLIFFEWLVHIGTEIENIFWSAFYIAFTLPGSPVNHETIHHRSNPGSMSRVTRADV